MRKTAFTLIETVMSLLILSIILAGSLVSLRSLSGSAQVQKEQAQMEGLASESLTIVQAMAEQGILNNPSYNFSPPKPIVVRKDGASKLVLCYADEITDTVNSNCGNKEYASDLSAAIDCPNNTCTLATFYQKQKGELVGIRKGAGISSGISMITPVSPSNIADTYAVYIRDITVAVVEGSQPGTFQVTVSVKKLFENDFRVVRTSVVYGT
jgi:type II secretory pathway pseudopilin PulG